MGCSAMSGREVYAIHAACIRGVEAFPVTVVCLGAALLPGGPRAAADALQTP